MDSKIEGEEMEDVVYSENVTLEDPRQKYKSN
jgi:hypothetical protein